MPFAIPEGDSSLLIALSTLCSHFVLLFSRLTPSIIVIIEQQEPILAHWRWMNKCLETETHDWSSNYWKGGVLWETEISALLSYPTHYSVITRILSQVHWISTLLHTYNKATLRSYQLNQHHSDYSLSGGRHQMRCHGRKEGGMHTILIKELFHTPLTQEI